MSTKFHWLKEAKETYSRSFGGGKVFIRNAYSQWVLRKGHDFELSEELEREDPNDFNYVASFDSLVGGSEVKPSEFTNQLNVLEPFIFGSDAKLGFMEPEQAEITAKTGLNAGATPAGAKEVFAALPIRTRSVLPAGVAVELPNYKAPADVDPKDMVIVGVIDDSINVAHERFQTHNGESRVDFAWIQDADTPKKGAPSYGKVPYGDELDRERITQAIKQFGDDHDGLFRHLGLVGIPGEPYRPSSLKFRQSHGTQVADLAAGYDKSVAVDPASRLNIVNRRLITVQLPALVTQDTSAASLIAATRSAIKYIFLRAEIISRCVGVPIPVVLNFSYSLSGGGRTAEHLIDRIMRRAALTYRLATKDLVSPNAPLGAAVSLVVPSGNQHLSRCHGVGTVSVDNDGRDRGQIDLSLRLQPNDQTSSYLEVWVPKGADKIKIEVADPTGVEHCIVYPDQGETGDKASPEPDIHSSWVLAATSDKNGIHPVCRVSLDEPHQAAQTVADLDLLYWRVLLAFAPTQCLTPSRPFAPHGVWQISVTSYGTKEKMRAWVQRDSALPGSKRKGRQAYLDDEAYDNSQFLPNSDVAIDDDDSASDTVFRNGTLTGLGGEPVLVTPEKDALIEPIVVGSMRWNTGAGSFFSAAGNEITLGPHAMAASEASRVLSNLIVTGGRNGSVTSAAGTSLSVPQVSRWLADKLAKTPAMDRVTFNSPKELLATTTPPRPTVPRPAKTEVPSDPAIRFERLRKDGILLAPHAELQAQLERRVRKPTSP